MDDDFKSFLGGFAVGWIIIFFILVVVYADEIDCWGPSVYYEEDEGICSFEGNDGDWKFEETKECEECKVGQLMELVGYNDTHFIYNGINGSFGFFESNEVKTYKWVKLNNWSELR